MDGDTIDVEDDGRIFRVRVYGIDCPEMGQPFAEQARKLTAALVEGKRVSLTPRESDRLGRTVADAVVSDGDSARSLGRHLVGAGLAWWYEDECPDNDHFERLQAQAREAKRGLWADPNAIPPWEYRRATGKQLQQKATPSSGQGHAG